MLNRRMPNGTYGGVRGERKSPLLDIAGSARQQAPGDQGEREVKYET